MLIKATFFFVVFMAIFSARRLKDTHSPSVPFSIYFRSMCQSETGIQTGISLDSATNNVKCLSFNGKDCAWGDLNSCKQSQAGTLKKQSVPLVCGLKHVSVHGGENPYLWSSAHWCKQGLAFYKYNGNWLCGGDLKVGYSVDIPFRLNTNGDVECFSLNGRDCAWGKGTGANCASYIKSNVGQVHSLVCGDMHKSIYGISGYDDKNHWCYNLMTQVFLKDNTKAF